MNEKKGFQVGDRVKNVDSGWPERGVVEKIFDREKLFPVGVRWENNILVRHEETALVLDEDPVEVVCDGSCPPDLYCPNCDGRKGIDEEMGDVLRRLDALEERVKKLERRTR